MCITDKAKETSSCADLFRCGAASVCLERGVFALPLGWLSLSSACLDATTIPHASGAWSRIFHLMQVCCLPWCPGCPVLRVLRAWLLGVCVSLALLCALLSWPACVPVAWCCGAVLCPAPWCVGLLRLPCGLGLYVGLVHGPIISPCYMGLFCGLVFRALYGPLKKGFIFARIFRLCISEIFPGFIFALKFPARFSGLQSPDFFRGDFSGENFPDIFPGFIFRHFFWPDFRGDIWLPLFSRCNIHTIPGSP